MLTEIAYFQGYEASITGVICPYDIDQRQLWEAWNRGFRDGCSFFSEV